MRITSFWRCSCGAELRTVMELDATPPKEPEIVMCPICRRLLEVDGGIIELRAINEAAASA
jgi:hypothetical protein